MIKLLASDIDGTIIDNDNQISPYNLEAIRKLNNKNVNFTLCTGKTYFMVKDFCKQMNAGYGIFGNGTQIINLKTGKEIIRNTLNQKDVIDCIDIANKNNLHIHIYIENKSVSQGSLKYMAYRNYKLYKENISFDVVDDLKQYININNPSILKLIISAEKDLGNIRKEILNSQNLAVMQIRKYNEYKDKIIDKEYEYLDIVPKCVNKYNSLKQLCDYLNIQKDEVMAIGDNMNDVVMIENAGIGVAIGGSYEEVIKKASYVTKNSAKDGGFAEAVYKFIEF